MVIITSFVGATGALQVSVEELLPLVFIETLGDMSLDSEENKSMQEDSLGVAGCDKGEAFGDVSMGDARVGSVGQCVAITLRVQPAFDVDDKSGEDNFASKAHTVAGSDVGESVGTSGSTDSETSDTGTEALVDIETSVTICS